MEKSISRSDNGVTLHSGGDPDLSDDTPSESRSPAANVIFYRPPTFWSMLRAAAINLALPFINGMMLGFGELFAHEAAFRLGWSNTNVFPLSRRKAHSIGPGIEAISPSSSMYPTLEDLAALE